VQQLLSPPPSLPHPDTLKSWHFPKRPQRRQCLRLNPAVSLFSCRAYLRLIYLSIPHIPSSIFDPTSLSTSTSTSTSSLVPRTTLHGGLGVRLLTDSPYPNLSGWIFFHPETNGLFHIKSNRYRNVGPRPANSGWHEYFDGCGVRTTAGCHR
jgi:hypothetical protein